MNFLIVEMLSSESKMLNALAETVSNVDSTYRASDGSQICT